MSRTYYLETFGCQMNKADSEAIAGLLETEGFESTELPEAADIILLNTCAVRDHAEQKAYSYLGRYLQMKNNDPRKLIAFAGCVAQKEAENLVQRFPGLDLVIGPRNFTALPEYINRLQTDRGRIVATAGEEELVDAGTPRSRQPDSSGKGWVTIMVGCDRFCSYCIVPHTREREKCREPADVEKEVHKLVEEGFKEITLLGQSVTGYGRKADFEADFVDLLERLDQLSGEFRLRFTSPYPGDIDQRLIDCFDRLEHLAPHLHLPVQSGSNKILKRMNRHYTRTDYLRVVKGIWELETDVAITTDAIVGFPGESEQDYEQTRDLFEKIGYDKAYIFKYSPREGTPAADYEDNLPQEIIDRRHTELLELYEEGARQRNQRHVGKNYRVLIEGESPKSRPDNRQLVGRTGHNNVVVLPYLGADLSGEFVDVKINKAASYTLFGEPVKVEADSPPARTVS